MWRVVRRRADEASMPPCSATARSRLRTRHADIHGPSQETGYIHQKPVADHVMAQMTSCVTMIGAPMGRAALLVTVRRSGFRFFHPELPNASRRSLRRQEERGIG